MTERGLTTKMVAAIAADLPGAVVLKHADRSTRFIPDVQVLCLDKASWIEVKFWRAKTRLKDLVEIGQVTLGHQLATTCGGRSWVVVYREDPQEITVWKPSALGGHLWPTIVLPHEPAHVYDVPACTPRPNLAKSIRAAGAIRFAGWDHANIAAVVRDGIRG